MCHRTCQDLETHCSANVVVMWLPHALSWRHSQLSPPDCFRPRWGCYLSALATTWHKSWAGGMSVTTIRKCPPSLNGTKKLAPNSSTGASLWWREQCFYDVVRASFPIVLAIDRLMVVVPRWSILTYEGKTPTGSQPSTDGVSAWPCDLPPSPRTCTELVVSHRSPPSLSTNTQSLTTSPLYFNRTRTNKSSAHLRESLTLIGRHRVRHQGVLALIGRNCLRHRGVLEPDWLLLNFPPRFVFCRTRFKSHIEEEKQLVAFFHLFAAFSAVVKTQSFKS